MKLTTDQILNLFNLTDHPEVASVDVNQSAKFGHNVYIHTVDDGNALEVAEAVKEIIPEAQFTYSELEGRKPNTVQAQLQYGYSFSIISIQTFDQIKKDSAEAEQENNLQANFTIKEGVAV